MGVIVDLKRLSLVRGRLGGLHDPAASPTTGAPSGAATPGQFGAMREGMGIMADPQMLARVRAGREAVAGGDVVPLAELPGASPPAAGGWEVVIVGPVARELAEIGEPSATALRELLEVIAAAPLEQGQALGMGLLGMRSARGATHRVLYAAHESRRLVTVMSVDGG